jgi:hypothetical protein
LYQNNTYTRLNDSYTTQARAQGFAVNKWYANIGGIVLVLGTALIYISENW